MLTSTDSHAYFHTLHTVEFTLGIHALKDSTTFQPTDSNTVYIVSNGEGKAYVTTTAPTTAVDVDTLG